MINYDDMEGFEEMDGDEFDLGGGGGGEYEAGTYEEGLDELLNELAPVATPIPAKQPQQMQGQQMQQQPGGRGGMAGPGARGPGAMAGPGARGPGAMAGPGARGPGAMAGPGARGPGAMAGPGARGMAGPGARGMAGPGARGMSGPGAMGGPALSAGPGANFNPNAPKPVPQTGGGADLPAGPDCVVCSEPIYGQVTQAMGKNYHPDHFVCEYCSQPFPGGRFLVGPDDNLYCEQDFMELHAKRCQVCNDIIRGKVVNANDMSFHSEHFICVGCGTNLVGKRYKVHPKTKHIYCGSCLEKEVRTIKPESHMCAMCNTPIVGPYLLIKGQFMHPRHFRCEECGKEFKGGDCHEFEGDFYCTPHYEILLLKKCARCGKPCKGRSVTAIGKVWHPDHFTCHVCNAPFVESHFYENEGLPYCQTHYIALFGDNCSHCKEPIVSGGLKFLDKAYHEHHFFCNTCQKPLKSGDFTAWDSKPICKGCYNKLPKKLRTEVERRLKEEKKAKITREKDTKKGE